MASKASLPDRLIARLAGLSDAELDTIAKYSLDLKADRGDGTARHCAAILRGSRLGAAPPIDDAAKLEEIEALVHAGRAASAVSTIARKYAKTPTAIRTLERRLRRKRAANKNGHAGPPRLASG